VSKAQLGGLLLTVFGVVLTCVKWFFSVDQIGSWNLIPLLAGITLTWFARFDAKASTMADAPTIPDEAEVRARWGQLRSSAMVPAKGALP
jgi:hypothetical protein